MRIFLSRKSPSQQPIYPEGYQDQYLSELDVSNMFYLQNLTVSENYLSCINLTGCVSLTYLSLDDNFLSQIEGPTHDEWSKNWHKDPEKASKIIRRLNSWVNEKLRSLSVVNYLEI